MNIFLLKLIHINSRRHSPKIHRSGFTILELLVTIVIASTAIFLILGLMVEAMTYNQREQALSQISDDMKQALNYISEDVREAIYVYDGQQLISRANNTLPGVNNYLPSFGANTYPILAFWKVVPVAIPNNLNCQTLFPSDVVRKSECDALKIERRAYSLIVYLQSTVNTGGQWKGESRIERYQLNKYTNLNTLQRTTGYVDPVSESNFRRWPLAAGGINLQVGNPPDSRDTLVDFVASPASFSKVCDDDATTSLKDCPEGYIRSPLDDNNYNSFFAFVRNATTDAGDTFNQDVILYLKGSGKGKIDTAGMKKYDFPFLRSQVLSRGVFNKTIID